MINKEIFIKIYGNLQKQKQKKEIEQKVVLKKKNRKKKISLITKENYS